MNENNISLLYISLTLEQKKNVRKKTVELLERQRKEPNR